MSNEVPKLPPYDGVANNSCIPDRPTYDLRSILSELNSWCYQHKDSMGYILPDDDLSLSQKVYKLFWAVKCTMESQVAVLGEFAKLKKEFCDLKGEFKDLYNFVHDFFDNLDLQEEVNNKIDKMVEDGTFADIIRPLLKPFKNKLDFNFCASPWWMDINNKPLTQEYIKNDIDNYYRMGVDGLTICAHVYSDNGVLYVGEDINNLEYGIKYAKKRNMMISAIKMHCSQSVFNSTITAQEQYIDICHSLMDRFKDYGITYFTFFNEMRDKWNVEATDPQAIVVTKLFEYARRNGYEPSITLTQTDMAFYYYKVEWLMKITNVICVNYYRSFGYRLADLKSKGNSMYQWSGKHDFVKYTAMDKKVILSESGTQHYWECLRNPSLFNRGQFEDLTDGEGRVAEVYYYGLFNNPELAGDLEEVWMWFPEQMHYQSFYNFVSKYTGIGGWIDL